MVMFLALHPRESISLNSFILIEHLAMLVTSTLTKYYSLRNFLSKAIGIINFAKRFLNSDALAVVRPNGVYLLDFVCSGIQFYVLLSPYLCFNFFLYLDLYVLGDDAWIS